MIRSVLVRACAVWLLLAAGAPGSPARQAQPPAKPPATSPPAVTPPRVRPVFENDRVRVIEVLWEPGAATQPAKLGDGDTVGVVVRGGAMEHALAAGKTERRERQTGDVLWQPGNRQIEARRNAGSSPIQIVQVLLKKAPPTGAYRAAPPGGRKVLDNRRVAVFDRELAPGQKIAMHKYAPRIWVVLEGGTLQATDPEGKQQQARVLPAQVLALISTEHSIENIGKRPVRYVSIELK